jgi:tellurite resistance protein
MTEPSRLQHFPITIFATIMGLCGLSIGWHKAEQFYQLSLTVSVWISYLALVVYLIISAFYLTKIIKHRAAFIAEFNHPIRLSFFPAFSISLILLGTVFLTNQPVLSKWLWSVGVVLHLMFTLYVLTAWINHTHFQINHINPAWFIPVVGNILVPIAGITHAPVDISWFFFTIALVFWILLFAMVLYRMFFHDPMPQRLLPTLFILIAPPAVGFVSYMKLTGDLDPFARILYYTALFTTLLLATQLPRFIKLPFFMSWWAYSFPLAAITVATMTMAELSDWRLYDYLSGLFFIVLNVVLLILIVRTLVAVKRQEICVEEK